GLRNDLGWSARHDVVAAVAEAHRRAPDAPVVVYGTSLGAAAALFAARALGHEVAAYVLAVRRRTRRYLPPIVEALAYHSLATGGRLALPHVDDIRPADAARGLSTRARVLIVAGGDDDRAPPSDARAIAAHAPHATVLVVDGLDHGDIGGLVTRDAWREVLDLLP
ncbi:MAG: hypothetical protein KC619_34445, partial [Myxococcales bacterium]|nr:hypothetical protein [Myxococcales bacterium]